MSAFGMWIDASGLTVVEVARRLGKHRTQVYRYIRGENIPRPETVERISEMTDGAIGYRELTAR